MHLLITLLACPGESSVDSNCSQAEPEFCNGVDDDGDGAVDAADPDLLDGVARFADDDGDGYGAGEGETRCPEDPGYVSVDGDCDDTNGDVHPAASELCDALDDDCDGLTDEADTDLADAGTWHPDADGDGHGAQDSSTIACAAPDGYVADGSDCDDADAAIPATTDAYTWSDAATDPWVDQDCDGARTDDDAATLTTGTWATGIGGGGALLEIAFSPYDSDVLYGATDMGLAYRSEDAGESFAPLPQADVFWSADPTIDSTIGVSAQRTGTAAFLADVVVIAAANRGRSGPDYSALVYAAVGDERNWRPIFTEATGSFETGGVVRYLYAPPEVDTVFVAMGALNEDGLAADAGWVDRLDYDVASDSWTSTLVFSGALPRGTFYDPETDSLYQADSAGIYRIGGLFDACFACETVTSATALRELAGGADATGARLAWRTAADPLSTTLDGCALEDPGDEVWVIDPATGVTTALDTRAGHIAMSQVDPDVLWIAHAPSANCQSVPVGVWIDRVEGLAADQPIEEPAFRLKGVSGQEYTYYCQAGGDCSGWELERWPAAWAATLRWRTDNSAQQMFIDEDGVHTLSVDAADSSRVAFSTNYVAVAGSWSGGFTTWRSLTGAPTESGLAADAPADWNETMWVSSGLDPHNVREVRVDPGNGSHLVAPTQDIFGMESWDGGASWRKMQNVFEHFAGSVSVLFHGDALIMGADEHHDWPEMPTPDGATALLVRLGPTSATRPDLEPLQTIQLGLSAGRVLSLLEVDDRIWLGTEGGGVVSVAWADLEAAALTASHMKADTPGQVTLDTSVIRVEDVGTDTVSGVPRLLLVDGVVWAGRNAQGESDWYVSSGSEDGFVDAVYEKYEDTGGDSCVGGALRDLAASRDGRLFAAISGDYYAGAECRGGVYELDPVQHRACRILAGGDTVAVDVGESDGVEYITAVTQDSNPIELNEHDVPGVKVARLDGAPDPCTAASGEVYEFNPWVNWCPDAELEVDPFGAMSYPWCMTTNSAHLVDDETWIVTVHGGGIGRVRYSP